MGKYRVILADPPWRYDVAHRNGAAQKHYPTMTLSQLGAMPVRDMASDDCVLIMWGTWPKLAEACIPLIDAWGFRYKTGMPWVKIDGIPVLDFWGEMHISPTFGTGYWFRGATEPVLIATRGHASPPEHDWVGLLCKRMQHSRKPDNIYQYAESLPGPYLELFARRKRDGWDVWGNEVESSIALYDPHP